MMQRVQWPHLNRRKDAYFIDSSNIDIQQVVQLVLRRCKSKKKPKLFRLLRKNASFFYQAIILVFYAFFKLFYKYRIYGLEHAFKGGAIIASNHVSFFDPPVLCVSYPEEVHLLGRETLFKSWFGFCIRKLNTHPVKGDVNNLEVMKTVCKLLKNGKKVVLFPEGTRSHDDKLGAIKPGIGMLIARTETAILPAYIHGNYDIWPRGHK